MAETLSSWLRRVRVSWPISGSHTLISLSPPAEMIRRPSWLNATPLTGPVWPASVARARPEGIAQTRTVWSSLAEARRWPSGSHRPVGGVLLGPPQDVELGLLKDVRRIDASLEPAVETHLHHLAQAVPVAGE